MNTGYLATSPLPKINNLVGENQKSYGKHFSNEEIISSFICSEKFQKFCNCRKNKVRPGIVLQIAIGKESKAYPLFGSGSISEFLINVKPCETKFYKSKTMLIRSRERNTKEIYCSASYYVTKRQDMWIAFPLLPDDGALAADKVLTAFRRLAALKNCKIVGQLQFSKGTVTYDGKEFITTQMWSVVVESAKGVRKHFTCWLDGGTLFEGHGYNLKLETPKNYDCGVIKTPFNHYYKVRKGVLDFRK